MNEKLSITLPAEMVEAINLQVEAGLYASPIEMLQRAMQALAREREHHAGRIAEMRARIAKSIADPRPPLTAEEVSARLDERMRRALEAGR